MKNILIVTALSQELKVAKSKIRDLSFKNIKISFLSVWKGNYNTILNLTRYLEWNWSIDFIINLWVCWYSDYKKDLIQVWRIYNLSNKKELIIPIFFEFSDLESIASSEEEIYKTIDLDENFVDMESYWFELVCDSFLLPRIILKVPVDKIWEETINFDYKYAISLLENNIDYEKLLEKIYDYLSSLEKEEDLSKYFVYYKFSFSEREIFKKLYNKYVSLLWNDFDIFFEKNNQMWKKEFLNYLKIYLEDFIVK